MTKVVHFHYYAKDNIGDVAVVNSVKHILSNYLRISTYTSMDVAELRWQIRRDLLDPLIKQARAPELISELTREVIKPFQLPKMINQHNLCVIGGGGLYSTSFFPMNNHLLKSIKIPIVLYGMGYQRNLGQKMLTKNQEKSIFELNNCAALSSVRDWGTHNFLRKLNIDNTHMVGDPAIFLESKRPFGIDFDKDKLKIGLNISCHGWIKNNIGSL